MMNTEPQTMREKMIPKAFTRLVEETQRNKKLVEELLIDLDPVLRSEASGPPVMTAGEKRSPSSSIEGQLSELIDILIDSNEYLSNMIRRLDI